jgi:hypothetical protein
LRVWVSTRRAEALLVRAEAALLAYLAGANRIKVLGVSSIRGFANDYLRMGQRTAAEMIDLHSFLVACPEAEVAFLDGTLTGCQIMAIGPILQRTGSDRGAVIDDARNVPVRELRARTRFRATDECATGEKRPGHSILFHGPHSFRPGERRWTSPGASWLQRSSTGVEATSMNGLASNCRRELTAVARNSIIALPRLAPCWHRKRGIPSFVNRSENDRHPIFRTGAGVTSTEVTRHESTHSRDARAEHLIPAGSIAFSRRR